MKDAYILFDERAITEGTGNAAVLIAYAGSDYATEAKLIKEAKQDVRDFGGNGLLCSYEVTGHSGGKKVIGNEEDVVMFVKNRVTVMGERRVQS